MFAQPLMSTPPAPPVDDATAELLWKIFNYAKQHKSNKKGQFNANPLLAIDKEHHATYLQVVRPVWLDMIETAMVAGELRTVSQLCTALQCVYTNAVIYNGYKSDIGIDARRILTFLENKMRNDWVILPEHKLGSDWHLDKDLLASEVCNKPLWPGFPMPGSQAAGATVPAPNGSHAAPANVELCANPEPEEMKEVPGDATLPALPAGAAMEDIDMTDTNRPRDAATTTQSTSSAERAVQAADQNLLAVVHELATSPAPPAICGGAASGATPLVAMEEKDSSFDQPAPPFEAVTAARPSDEHAIRSESAVAGAAATAVEPTIVPSEDGAGATAAENGIASADRRLLPHDGLAGGFFPQELLHGMIPQTAAAAAAAAAAPGVAAWPWWGLVAAPVAEAWSQLDKNVWDKVCDHAKAVVKCERKAVQYKFSACAHFKIAVNLLEMQGCGTMIKNFLMPLLFPDESDVDKEYEQYRQRADEIAHLFKQREDWPFWLAFKWNNAGSHIKMGHFRTLHKSYLALREKWVNDEGLSLADFHQHVFHLLTSSRHAEGEGEDSLASKLVRLGVRENKPGKTKQPAGPVVPLAMPAAAAMQVQQPAELANGNKANNAGAGDGDVLMKDAESEEKGQEQNERQEKQPPVAALVHAPATEESSPRRTRSVTIEGDNQDDFSNGGSGGDGASSHDGVRSQGREPDASCPSTAAKKAQQPAEEVMKADRAGAGAGYQDDMLMKDRDPEGKEEQQEDAPEQQLHAADARVHTAAAKKAPRNRGDDTDNSSDDVDAGASSHDEMEHLGQEEEEPETVPARRRSGRLVNAASMSAPRRPLGIIDTSDDSVGDDEAEDKSEGQLDAEQDDEPRQAFEQIQLLKSLSGKVGSKEVDALCKWIVALLLDPRGDRDRQRDLHSDLCRALKQFEAGRGAFPNDRESEAVDSSSATQAAASSRSRGSKRGRAGSKSGEEDEEEEDEAEEEEEGEQKHEHEDSEGSHGGAASSARARRSQRRKLQHVPASGFPTSELAAVPLASTGSVWSSEAAATI